MKDRMSEEQFSDVIQAMKSVPTPTQPPVFWQQQLQRIRERIAAEQIEKESVKSRRFYFFGISSVATAVIMLAVFLFSPVPQKISGVPDLADGDDLMEVQDQDALAAAQWQELDDQDLHDLYVRLLGNVSPALKTQMQDEGVDETELSVRQANGPDAAVDDAADWVTDDDYNVLIRDLEEIEI